ncbi:MAG: LD-carboxypeptidase [Kiritimatiellae bacterium]|nr:LD-carboxypeptidase [Kiritimatiellia bacterium]
MTVQKTIGLVAPAGAINKETIQSASEICRQHGFAVVESKHLYGKERHYSGTIQERADDINDFLSCDDIDIIYAARGGSGSPMILDLIDWPLWKEKQKPLIGFSDITALQLALFKKTGLPSLSGMGMTTHMTENNIYKNLSFEILKGKTEITLDDIPNAEIKIEKSGTFSGILIGGCLTTITTLIGTEYLPTNEDIILVIEDVNEPVYVIERNLFHLKQIGFLDKVKGLIIGKFTYQKNEIDVWNESGYLFENLEFAVSNFPYGHIENCVAVPLGVNAKLTTKPFTLQW